ncbi:TPA: hypothetical protein ACYVH5_003217 [Klebsiella pneumoniae]
MLLHVIQSAIGSDHRIDTVDQSGQRSTLGINICRGAVHTIPERAHLSPGTGDSGLITGVICRRLLDHIAGL